MARNKFHVFLSHNSADKPAVEELARRLKAEGIEGWFDKWHLIPGEPWQEALERALADSATVAVFVGPSGFGPWQNEEMRAALARRVSESEGSFRVIPVLLPGATREERSRLPTFLVPDAHVLRLLCDAVEDTPTRIEKPEGQRIAQRLLTVMEQDPERGSKLEMLHELSRSLRSLPENLEFSGDGRGLTLLVRLINDSGNPEIHDSFVEVVKSLAALATSTECRRGIELFGRAMSDATDTQDAHAFARCLTAVAIRLAQSNGAEAIQRLLAAIQTTNQADALQDLSKGLSQLSGQLTENDGRLVIERLFDVMDGTKSSRYQRVLAECLAEFSTLLSEEDRTRAKKRLLAEVRADVVPPDLELVAQALAALPISLSPEEALPAMKVLVDWLDRVTKAPSIDSISTALRMLAGKLTPDAAEAAAIPILAAMKKTRASEKMLALASGLSGMNRQGKTLLRPATIQAAYQSVLDRMNDKTDIYFSQPINLSLLAQTFKILPGDTPVEVANEAIRQLLAALVKSENADALQFLVDGLGYVGGDLSKDVSEQAVRQIVEEINSERRTRLKRGQVLALASFSIALEATGKFPDSCAADVVSQLDYAMNVTTDNAAQKRLAEALALMTPKLPTESEGTRKAIKRIRLAMQSANDPAVIGALANGWEKLAARMTKSESRDAFHELLIKLEAPANIAARSALTRAAVAIVQSPDSNQLIQSLKRLLSVLHRDLDPELLDVFLSGIKTVASQIAPGDVDRAKERILAVTTEQSQLNDQVMNGLIGALDALPGQIETRELVELLKSPFCIGEAQRSLLEMIETQTKLKLDGNPWILVEHAKEAGLDSEIFRSPAKRPKPVAPIDPPQQQ